jgi:DNA-binding transcriptional MocR family regulator
VARGGEPADGVPVDRGSPLYAVQQGKQCHDVLSAPAGDRRRFTVRLAERDVRVAQGPWFGDSDRVFRLGFGQLPPADFTEAMTRLAAARLGG